jgi:hypothetical protein
LQQLVVGQPILVTAAAVVPKEVAVAVVHQAWDFLQTPMSKREVHPSLLVATARVSTFLMQNSIAEEVDHHFKVAMFAPTLVAEAAEAATSVAVLVQSDTAAAADHRGGILPRSLMSAMQLL